MPWLVYSEFFINIARGIFTLTIGMLLFEQSESLWAFAFVFASEFAIGLFLQGVAGTIVDKHGPIRVLLLATFASVLVLGIPLYMTDELNTLTLIHIALGLNLFRPFIRNSVFVLIPELIDKDKLEQFNAYISMALQAGQIIGMALAGLLLELFDPIFTIQAVLCGYLCALTFYLLTTCKHKSNRITSTSNISPSEKNTGSWKEVLQFLRTQSGAIYTYIIPTIDYMAMALFNLLLAPAVKYNFDNLPRWLTFIDGSFAAGAIVGGALIAKNTLNDVQRLQLTSISIIVVALIFIGYALVWDVWLIMASTFVFGMLTTISTVTWMSVQQRLAPPHIKGRLASIRYIGNACFACFATVIVSFANDFGMTEASYTAAFCVTLMLIVAWVYKPKPLSKVDSPIERETETNPS
jgi:predicted MFS family arabinose efflux permease